MPNTDPARRGSSSVPRAGRSRARARGPGLGVEVYLAVDDVDGCRRGPPPRGVAPGDPGAHRPNLGRARCGRARPRRLPHLPDAVVRPIVAPAIAVLPPVNQRGCRSRPRHHAPGGIPRAGAAEEFDLLHLSEELHRILRHRGPGALPLLIRRQRVPPWRRPPRDAWDRAALCRLANDWTIGEHEEIIPAALESLGHRPGCRRFPVVRRAGPRAGRRGPLRRRGTRWVAAIGGGQWRLLRRTGSAARAAASWTPPIHRVLLSRPPTVSRGPCGRSGGAALGPRRHWQGRDCRGR